MIDSSPQRRKAAARSRPDPEPEAALLTAVELLYFGYRAFTEPPDRILEQRGLGRVHHRILHFVGRRSGLSVNELLKVLHVSKQALNVPLRQLVEMGLVEISAADHDRRVRRLVLTSAGSKLEAQLTGAQMKLLRKVFDAAGSGAEAGWLAVMRALAQER